MAMGGVNGLPLNLIVDFGGESRDLPSLEREWFFSRHVVFWFDGHTFSGCEDSDVIHVKGCLPFFGAEM